MLDVSIASLMCHHNIISHLEQSSQSTLFPQPHIQLTQLNPTTILTEMTEIRRRENIAYVLRKHDDECTLVRTEEEDNHS